MQNVFTGDVAARYDEDCASISTEEALSPMLDELRRKPGGDALPVIIGDMATTTVPGTYNLVYLVFNTLSNLIEQDEQVACFANAAAHLAPGGVCA